VSAAVAIAAVVFVLLGALALDNGLQKTLDNSGAQDLAVVLRAGAETELNSSLTSDQIKLIANSPGIAQSGGKGAVSPELYIVVDGIKKSTRTKSNISLRGVISEALATQARQGVRIVEGRMFSPGSNEIIVGRGIARDFIGFSTGEKIRLRGVDWIVVGIFESNGSVFESELWGDLRVVQNLFNRHNIVQSIRVRLTHPESIAQLIAYNKAEPRLHLDIKTEQQYYADQARGITDAITYIGKPLAAMMALGALAGALNAMYSSVAARTGEIVTLRIIGFASLSTFIGTLAESFMLACIGAILGTALAYIAFNNGSAATMGASFTQIVFDMQLSGHQLAEGSIWAAFLGFLGGIFPALRAARQPIIADTAA
jgi:putative ABC transport system permease protein